MTSAQKSLVKSLDRKKHRDELGLFVAEGEKLVVELLSSNYKSELIFFTDSFNHTIEGERISQKEMSQISNFKTPSSVLGVFYIPKNIFNLKSLQNSLIIALDEVQNPGNLGTIIRLADWFGIKNIVCSENTVDTFNPKVIQASMGAISRVKTHYLNLKNILESAHPNNMPVYGTFLEGENIYNTPLTANGIILMGNEGRGISEDLEYFVNIKLNIPSFSQNTSESLNVAIATAIVCSEFKRTQNSIA